VVNNNKAEYLEEELEDQVLQAILRRCYHTFRLFNNTFAAVLAQYNTNYDVLRLKFDMYMRYFLPSVRFNQLHFFTDIYGFQFLPVDKPTFLSVQYLINTVQTQFNQLLMSSSKSNNSKCTSSIASVACMYSGKLIWSGLNQDDMFLLYNLDQESMNYFYQYLAANEAVDWDSYSTVDTAKLLSIYEKFGQKKKKTEGTEESSEPQMQDHNWSAEKCKEFNVDFLSTEKKSAKQRAESISGTYLPQNRLSTAGTVAGGFSTGPFRTVLASNLPPAAASQPGLSSPAWITPLPFNLLDKASNNSPRVYLSTDLPGISRFENNPALQKSKENQEIHGHSRLVVYQRYKLTFFFIVNEIPCLNSSDNSANSSEIIINSSSIDNTGEEIKALASDFSRGLSISIAPALSPSEPRQFSPSTVQSATTPTNLAVSSIIGTALPSAEFYSLLEGFIHTHLKKLAEILADYSARNTGNSVGGTNFPSGANSASSGTNSSEESYRFLYFNHMNLALKTSLHSARSSPLTMEIIKIIREMHQDFNAINPRDKRVIETTLRRDDKENNSSGNSQNLKQFLSGENSVGVNSITGISNVNQGISIHSGLSSVHSHGPALSNGANEIIVRTRGSGWVVGRRANQTHREFFVLLDEKIPSIAEIQQELDNLAKTYFYNIFNQ
jgi:hypothetical protein